MEAALLLGALVLLSSGSSSTRAAPPPAPPPTPKSSPKADWDNVGNTVAGVIKTGKKIIDAFADW